ncbi:glycosyltransferase family 117 protein, partial [Xanthomarina gelatinilytica]
MTHFSFKKWNTLLGWFSFLIALTTYSLTVEPTVSFWDAGEYILTSSKLQVGHPPGAPLFQMFGAFFSMFALEPSQIGLVMNLMSAVASAFTILFMFWSISLLLKKIITLNGEFTPSKQVAVLGSALVGSLAFTFTDSFWFNAVETEVYAMATLIMSVLFYLGLRWEQDMDKPRGNKWLILIAFIIGLSFGVHFMGLLTIPAIGLIYYFKNYKTVTVKNFIVANVVSVAILLFIFKLLLPNALKIFSAFEIFFVNSIGMPFNSGTIIAGLVLIAAFYFGIKYTRDKNYTHLNTAILCLMFIFIGFSSWLMLPIRANANVVINENDPSDARELLAYYNLEQYPETHLFYGPLFTDQYSGLDENEPYVDDKPNYEKDYETGKYVIINDWKNAKQNYNHEHASIL